MEADFSGYATKAELRCSDGRIIMPDAFKHQDGMQVPLVWQHGHTDPENVLGHVLLENRHDGVYAYAFFNGTKKAEHARELVQHKDIKAMSIWANDLIERTKRVIHGAIREVSLVLSGANPGAVIENVTLRHSDGEETTLDDEVIITTGLEFEHAIGGIDAAKSDAQVVNSTSGSGSGDEETLQDIYDSLSDKQKEVVHYLIGEALSADAGSAAQDNLRTALGSLKHDTSDKDKVVTGDDKDKEGNKEMKHNVFEADKDKEKDGKTAVLSHDDISKIISDATRTGSLKGAVEAYAEEHLEHGIEDIDVLFPDAVNLDTTPQFLSRRVEWVASLLGAVRKSPFSRIKTMAADITVEEARAKGYIKGSLKKEEFFGVTRRTTTPTTIYKKQQLDRDDVVDITDFDVVVWLKGEMRLMLDEELARAILIGDGRDPSDDDKINEGNIRPIAKEHELFATTVTVNLSDANSSINELVDAVVAHRRDYRGTGTPTMFTSETIISKFMLLRDTLGRRIYNTIAEVSAELRVSSIVPVEAMEDDPDVVAIIVNPADYVVGATAGGQVSMFDDFDIDYNLQKYLIETRVSGALTRLKSALIFRQSASTDVAVVPNAPTYVEDTGVVTIVATTHVVYKNADTGATLSTGAQTALAVGETLNVTAEAADGYYVESTADAYWTFNRPE
jgi:Phage capsid family/Caudovirus prohead serine protease